MENPCPQNCPLHNTDLDIKQINSGFDGEYFWVQFGKLWIKMPPWIFKGLLQGYVGTYQQAVGYMKRTGQLPQFLQDLQPPSPKVHAECSSELNAEEILKGLEDFLKKDKPKD